MSLDNASDCACYVHCNFCNTTLVVSIPATMMFNVVTVRCGHCANLLSLNMGASLETAHHVQNVHRESLFYEDLREDSHSSKPYNKAPVSNSSENEASRKLPMHAIGKRRRSPSAYNRFIKEEIQRIKAKNPEISHKEAFSTAAKNWAYLPHTHFGFTTEKCQQA